MKPIRQRDEIVNEIQRLNALRRHRVAGPIRMELSTAIDALRWALNEQAILPPSELVELPR